MNFNTHKLCDFARFIYSEEYDVYIEQMNQLLDYIPNSREKFFEPDIKIVDNKFTPTLVCKLTDKVFTSRKAIND